MLIAAHAGPTGFGSDSKTSVTTSAVTVTTTVSSGQMHSATITLVTQ